VYKSIWIRFSMVLGALVVGVSVSGCGGEEKIPLAKLDPIVEVPPKKPSEIPRNVRGGAGTSSKIGRDPSGMHPKQQ
jgi:hypothetical protein